MIFHYLILALVLLAHVPRLLAISTVPPAEEKCQGLTALAENKDLVVRGGAIVTMAPGDRALLADGVVHICDGRIAFVGEASAYTDAVRTRLPCPDAATLHLRAEDVVVPAFINTHTHAAMSLFKNLGNDRALADWLNNYIFPLEQSLADERFCRVGATLSMAEFLASGVSTFADMYFFQTHVAEEVSRVGMRAMLGQSVIDFPQPDGATPNDTLKVATAYINKWKGDELVTPLVVPHAPYTTSEWVYREAVALNRRNGLRTWTHCSETQDENALFRAHQGLPEDSNESVAQWLSRIGALGNDFVCAHAVWLSDEDIALFKQTGTKVAHCPSSNLKLASGFMRYSALHAAGVPVGVGTDGHASNNDVDMLEEGRTAALIHKGRDLDPTTMPAYDALWHMTLGGATVIGKEKEQGSIEVGKLGDLAIFRGNTVKFTPRFDIGVNGTMSVNDTAALLMYNANAHDIKATVVNGRLLYKDGCYTTIDKDKLFAESNDISLGVRAYLQSLDENNRTRSASA